LDIGNSFYMFNVDKKFAYFSENNKDKEIISKYINFGILDSLHSFGEKHNFTREDAKISITELKTLNKKVDVWIDHTKKIDNIGDDITGGEGDIKTSKVYHSDLLKEYGFRYFWLGRVTSIVGQECKINIKLYSNMFDIKYFIKSINKMLKEFIKHMLAIIGNKKYALHRDNRLVRIRTLRDGMRVFEFIRCDSHWNGIGRGANSKGLAYNLSKKNLNFIKESNSYMIVYTHLGKNHDCESIIAKETEMALRYLEEEFKNGNIYVTNTSKILKYYVYRKYMEWKKEEYGGEKKIIISGIQDPIAGKNILPNPSDLEGITFYVDDPENTRIFIGKKEVKNIINNPKDHTGKRSIMFPMTRLFYENEGFLSKNDIV